MDASRLWSALPDCAIRVDTASPLDEQIAITLRRVAEAVAMEGARPSAARSDGARAAIMGAQWGLKSVSRSDIISLL